MKISIIGGASRVGTQVAFSLLHRNIKITEIILEDIVDAVKGEAMDLQHAAAAMNKNVKIIGTKDLKDCENSDMIIITAGIPLSKAKTSDRYELLGENIKILKFILENISQNDKTIYIIITNPVDVMTYFLAKKINDRRRVIGISTLTDTARMNSISTGYLIGEHSGFMIPINGEIDTDKITQMGLDVVKSKGGTWFTTPVGITNIIESIVNDEKKQFPVSTLMTGEYGLENVCLSVPCIIGKECIEEIKEIELTDEQKEILKKAEESVKNGIEVGEEYWKE